MSGKTIKPISFDAVIPKTDKFFLCTTGKVNHSVIYYFEFHVTLLHLREFMITLFQEKICENKNQFLSL